MCTAVAAIARVQSKSQMRSRVYHLKSGAMLASFKLSCNTDFGDAGAIALASALPPILRDLGLVGFKIGGLGEHDQH